MVGETVTVHGRAQTGVDAFGAPIWRDVDEQVADVIVAPGPTSDVTGGNRPDGVRIAYTLHFPKTWTGSVVGLDVTVRGRRCHVVGDPDRYTDADTPGAWDMPVEVVMVDG